MTKRSSEQPPPSTVSTSERMAFQEVDNVFCALQEAFVLNRPEGEEISQKFLGLWYLFLSCANWTEDEYFETLDVADSGTCTDCGGDMDEHEESDEEVVRNNVVNLSPPKKNEMN